MSSSVGVVDTPQDRLHARLADPDTIDSLNRLLDHLDLVVFMVEALDGFLHRSDEIADSAASLVDDLRRARVDLGGVQELAARTPRIVEALGKLTDSRALDHVPALVDAANVLAESGMLEPRLVQVLGDLGQRLGGAYSEAAAKPVQPLGAIALLRALGEPEVQRAMGLLVAVARRVGRDLH